MALLRTAGSSRSARTWWRPEPLVLFAADCTAVGLLVEGDRSSAGWFLSAFDFAVITGVHLVAVCGDLLAALETGDFPEPIGLDGGNIVVGLAIQNQICHDHANGGTLHDSVPTESRA